MTEREVITTQELNGNQEFLLILIGSFLHAYGHGAFALSRATGYRVLRKQRKGGEVLTAGFPIGKLDDVRRRILEKGGELESIDEKTWTFRGIDGTPDLSMVRESVGQVHDAGRKPDHATCTTGSWLEEAVRSYNLSLSTPMDAIMFIGTLQQRLKENDDACESPAG